MAGVALPGDAPNDVAIAGTACLDATGMKAPEQLIIAWRGRQLRVRHAYLKLGPAHPARSHAPSGLELASDVEGLRLVLMTTVGDCYGIKVADDGSGGVVGL